jgi:hypothetical protein
MILSFMAITGWSASMTRAGLVAGLSLWAWYYGRKFHPVTLLAIAASVTATVYPPYAWGDIGWALSFAAFAGVMIIAPIVTSYFFGSEKVPFVGNGCDVEVLSTEDAPSIMKDKKIRDKFLSNSDHIVEELDMLRQITVASNSGKKKKKKSSRNLLKEAKRRKKLLSKVGIGGGRKVKDLLKEYAARVDGTFEEDEGDATVMYRGVTIRKSELDDIELMDIMKKAGFTRRSDNSMVHSKKMRKMIRNRTKEAKKRNKKKRSG